MGKAGNQIECIVEQSVPFSIEAFVLNGCRAMDSMGLKRCVVSLVLTDDAAVCRLNAQWRGKNTPTDVLSFPLHEPTSVPSADSVLGDIVVSIDTAQKQARERDHELVDEVVILFVHGLCHLIGHTHDLPESAAQMARLENKLVCVMNQKPEGSNVGLVQAAMDVSDV